MQFYTNALSFVLFFYNCDFLYSNLFDPSPDAHPEENDLIAPQHTFQKGTSSAYSPPVLAFFTCCSPTSFPL